MVRGSPAGSARRARRTPHLSTDPDSHPQVGLLPQPALPTRLLGRRGSLSRSGGAGLGNRSRPRPARSSAGRPPVQPPFDVGAHQRTRAPAETARDHRRAAAARFRQLQRRSLLPLPEPPESGRLRVHQAGGVSAFQLGDPGERRDLMPTPPPPFPYETRLNILCQPLEVIDEKALADACEYTWYNQTLCRVNRSEERRVG